MNQLSFKPKSK